MEWGKIKEITKYAQIKDELTKEKRGEYKAIEVEVNKKRAVRKCKKYIESTKGKHALSYSNLIFIKMRVMFYLFAL
jgi:hypothetical protein